MSPVTFTERMVSWKEEIVRELRKRWWWVLIASPILAFIGLLIEDRITGATNRYLDEHLSMYAITGHASYPARFVVACSLVAGSLLVWLIFHAYLETRPNRKLHTRFINARVFPNIRTATMRDLVDSENKVPGWEKRRIGWEWFMEVQVVNGPRPTTIEDIEVEVKLDGETKEARVLDDAEDYMIDMAMDENANFHHFSGGDRYRPVGSFISGGRWISRMDSCRRRADRPGRDCAGTALHVAG